MCLLKECRQRQWNCIALVFRALFSGKIGISTHVYMTNFCSWVHMFVFWFVFCIVFVCFFFLFCFVLFCFVVFCCVVLCCVVLCFLCVCLYMGMWGCECVFRYPGMLTFAKPYIRRRVKVNKTYLIAHCSGIWYASLLDLLYKFKNKLNAGLTLISYPRIHQNLNHIKTKLSRSLIMQYPISQLWLMGGWDVGLLRKVALSKVTLTYRVSTSGVWYAIPQINENKKRCKTFL